MTSWQHRSATASKHFSYKHRFVDALPDMLEDGILYVSVQYATSAHNCFCGCGHEVVTPIHPTKWQMIFDGVNVSFHPSVGNWSLPCRSHYWLRDGRVSWADTWSDNEIAAARSRDLADQDRYFEKSDTIASPARNEGPRPISLWHWFMDWFEGK